MPPGTRFCILTCLDARRSTQGRGSYRGTPSGCSAGPLSSVLRSACIWRGVNIHPRGYRSSCRIIIARHLGFQGPSGGDRVRALTNSLRRHSGRTRRVNDGGGCGALRRLAFPPNGLNFGRARHCGLAAAFCLCAAYAMGPGHALRKCGASTRSLSLDGLLRGQMASKCWGLLRAVCARARRVHSVA